MVLLSAVNNRLNTTAINLETKNISPKSGKDVASGNLLHFRSAADAKNVYSNITLGDSEVVFNEGQPIAKPGIINGKTQSGPKPADASETGNTVNAPKRSLPGDKAKMFAENDLEDKALAEASTKKDEVGSGVTGAIASFFNFTKPNASKGNVAGAIAKNENSTQPDSKGTVTGIIAELNPKTAPVNDSKGDVAGAIACGSFGSLTYMSNVTSEGTGCGGFAGGASTSDSSSSVAAA